MIDEPDPDDDDKEGAETTKDEDAEETTVDAEPGKPKSSRNWLALITDSQRYFQFYQDKADGIDKQYASLERLAADVKDPEFQLFWANIAVLGPSIYSRPPVSVVVPRFKDRKPLPRAGAELLERATNVAFDMEDIDSVMRAIRDDITVSARGVAWLRYETSGKGVNFTERVCIDQADRKDFAHDPAQKWKDVDWVSKRSWLSKKDMRKRFKKYSGDAYKDCTYTKRKDDDDNAGGMKAGVWELWSKSRNRVVWVSPGCDVVLDENEPHLTLEGFFPCPRPAYSTLQRRTLIPVPDMLFYKDQLEEINGLTARISALTDALRVRGFYPAGAGDIGDAIEIAIKRTDDNQILVPINSWKMIGDGTGVKDLIVWLPLDMIAKTVTGLVALRKQLIDDVYQITGLSDIMRGQTAASETLGAQNLKSQYGQIRIRDRQDEMVRMARDITRIAAEIMAENFKQETLLDMSQLDMMTEALIKKQIAPLQQQLDHLRTELRNAQTDPEIQQMVKANPDQAKQIMAQVQGQAQHLQGQIEQLGKVPTIEAVMKMLREQKVRPFVLDIETDSTIAPDENTHKQRANEFTTAFGGFMKEALPLVETMPEAAPVAAQMMKFVTGQFRAGREMEGIIDTFADAMIARAGQPKPPDPKMAEAAAKQQAEQAREQADNAERMAESQRVAAEAQTKLIDAQTRAANDASKRSIEEQREQDAALARQIERDGKVALTNKQIEILDAKRADDAARHAQEMEKGGLEIAALQARGLAGEASAAVAGALA
jgi:hypothetical protein